MSTERKIHINEKNEKDKSVNVQYLPKSINPKYYFRTHFSYFFQYSQIIRINHCKNR